MRQKVTQSNTLYDFSDALQRISLESTPSESFFQLKQKPTKSNLQSLLALEVEVDILRVRKTKEWVVVKGRKGRGALPMHLRQIRDAGGADVWLHTHIASQSGESADLPSPNDVAHGRKVGVSALIHESGLTFYDCSSLVNPRGGGVWNPKEDELIDFFYRVHDPANDLMMCSGKEFRRRLIMGLDEVGVKRRTVHWSEVDEKISLIN